MSQDRYRIRSAAIHRPMGRQDFGRISTGSFPYAGEMGSSTSTLPIVSPLEYERLNKHDAPKRGILFLDSSYNHEARSWRPQTFWSKMTSCPPVRRYYRFAIYHVNTGKISASEPGQEEIQREASNDNDAEGQLPSSMW